jgi:hypothetical protein
MSSWRGGDLSATIVRRTAIRHQEPVSRLLSELRVAQVWQNPSWMLLMGWFYYFIFLVKSPQGTGVNYSSPSIVSRLDFVTKTMSATLDADMAVC